MLQQQLLSMHYERLTTAEVVPDPSCSCSNIAPKAVLHILLASPLFRNATLPTLPALSQGCSLPADNLNFMKTLNSA